jgi:hypothetical protein
MTMPANTWTFSGWAKEQHEKVKAAAKAGNHAEAMRCLQAFGVYAGIAALVANDTRLFGTIDKTASAAATA